MLQLSTTGVLMSYLFIGVIVLILIGVGQIELRQYLPNRNSADRRKRVLHVFAFRGLLLRVGFALALASAIVALSWTTTTVEKNVLAEMKELPFEDIDVAPPIYRPQKKVPKSTSLEKIEEIDEVFDPLDEDFDLEDDLLESLTELEPEERTAKVATKPAKKIALVQLDEGPEEIFKVVEQMPRFPGCEDMTGSDEEKDLCAKRKLYKFLNKNLKYPSIAKETNTEGTVVIRFVVDKTGVIENAEIRLDIGSGCGREALRVVNLMKTMPERWTPGRQRGRPVKVYFNLPINFELR